MGEGGSAPSSVMSARSSGSVSPPARTPRLTSACMQQRQWRLKRRGAPRVTMDGVARRPSGVRRRPLQPPPRKVQMGGAGDSSSTSISAHL